LERAREYYESAISLDPKFARAHVLFGDYYFSLAGLGLLPAHLAMPSASAQAEKALALDPQFLEAESLLASVAGVYDYDWKQADERFRRSMSHPPFDPVIRWAYAAFYLLPTGRMEEAIAQLKRVLEEDPLNLRVLPFLTWTLGELGRYSEADAVVRQM